MPSKTMTQFYRLWNHEAMISALMDRRRFSFISTRREATV